MQKRILGLMLCSMGSGMLIVIILPGWGFLLAGLMVIIGAYFMCNR